MYKPSMDQTCMDDASKNVYYTCIYCGCSISHLTFSKSVTGVTVLFLSIEPTKASLEQFKNLNGLC